MLRCRDHLFGKTRLSESQRALVLSGNRLAVWSILFALEFYKAGGDFAIQNPEELSLVDCASFWSHSVANTDFHGIIFPIISHNLVETHCPLALPAHHP